MSERGRRGTRRGLGVAALLLLSAVVPARADTPSHGSTLPGVVKVEVANGVLIAVKRADLANAEKRIVDATRTTRTAVMASLDPTLLAVAVWTLSHTYGPDSYRAEILRPCRDPECDADQATAHDPEPPADPPKTPSNPAPSPTCYQWDDERSMESGAFTKETSFIFHQHVEYCVEGQLILPNRTLYSWADHINELWQCQNPEGNFNIASTPTPNALLAHSTGQCWWYTDAGVGTVEAGRYAPTIHDTYGNDGQRWLRTGSSH